jgi:hypothetical protein
MPPGGSFNYRGSSWTPMGTPRDSRSETRVASSLRPDHSRAAAEKASSTLASPERVVQVLQPRMKDAAASPQVRISPSGQTLAGEEPRRLPTSDGAVEITDLPPAGRSASATRATPPGDGHNVRPVSGVEEPADSAVEAAVGVSAGAADRTSASEFAPRATYGYDPAYGWLRGKLEYSQIDRRWKLRYIPVDGETDKFGGSVVLPGAKALAGCERGDFIEVRGRLGPQASNDGYAPTYEVAELKRLSEAAR